MALRREKASSVILLGFLKDAFPKRVEGLQVWAEAYQGNTGSDPLFEFTVTDEVTTESLNMNPEDVMPFFPIQAIADRPSFSQFFSNTWST